jgi:PhoH-like ATPase
MNQFTYILDTNIILSDAECLFKFEEHNIVIPLTVIDEIDTRKRDQNELGRNARAFSRYVDELRTKGNLIHGVELNEKGGKLSILLFDQNIASCLPFQDMSIMDNRILASAMYLKAHATSYVFKINNVVLVSNDVNMRIKADLFGIPAESYKHDRIKNDELYTGIRHITVPSVLINSVYENEKLEEIDLVEYILDAYPNECFVIHGDCNLKQSALIRYNSVMHEYKLLPQDMKTVDILPRNTEQQFLLDMLKDTNLSLVSVNGKAGSGKTLMSLAAALYGVLETQQYNKVLLLKPIVSMDNSHDIGFLPGTMEEKLAPWMASYSDNIEVIMAGYLKDDTSSFKKKNKKGLTRKEEMSFEKDAAKINPMAELISLGLLEVGSLQHVRGRSLPNQYIILDECQNLGKNALRTIVTRLGEGSKIILLGDISQIDSPYLDSRSNALSIVAEVFKSQSIAGHITLRKSERSKLAEIASELL